MKEVTKEQFYALMGPLNVHPRIMTSYPYTSEWRLQDMSRKMVGKTNELLQQRGREALVALRQQVDRGLQCR